MADGVTVDMSEIAKLAAIFPAAAATVTRDAGDEVSEIADRIASEARSTAAGYPHGTGALAAAIDVRGSGLSAEVGADVREAFYLEYGSPNTGGPRPWLSGPATRGAVELATLLGKIGIAALER